jgi:predicted ribonuclease YlaK
MKQEDKKIYVIDTCVLIDDPDVFFELACSEIVVPTAVIKELDALKRNPNPDNPKARAARKVIRNLDEMGRCQSMVTGAKTSSGSIVKICNRFVPIDDLASSADNRIVGTAIRLRKDTGREVILLSKDGNVRNVARSYVGIKAQNYSSELSKSDNAPRSKIYQYKRPAPISVRDTAINNGGRRRKLKQASLPDKKRRSNRILLAAALSAIVFFILMTIRQ